jgi:hypothetical protein
MNQKHRGRNFDDFLMEEGLYAEVQALAVKNSSRSKWRS